MTDKITIDEIKQFFSLSKKIELLAIKCVNELVVKHHFQYSNNTNHDWSSINDSDLRDENLQRCGKYFKYKNNYYFLGVTLNECSNSFCLAFLGNESSVFIKKGALNDNWYYCKVCDSIINSFSDQEQLEKLVKFIEEKIGLDNE